MPVEQMNIAISPQMAKFIRGKVRSGGYTSASEVVRSAVRRMQEDERREVRLASTTADKILDELTAAEASSIKERVLSGIASIEKGEFTEYVGRAGLKQLADEVKTRGRKRLALRARKA